MSRIINWEIFVLVPIQLIAFLAIILYTCLRSRHSLLLAIAGCMVVYCTAKLIDPDLKITESCDFALAAYIFALSTI